MNSPGTFNKKDIFTRSSGINSTNLEKIYKNCGVYSSTS